MSSEAVDIIVVGGGTAGCVLASRLSEDQNLQVLLLEAGEDLTADPRSSVPFLGSSLLATPANWGFETTPQENLRFRKTIAPAGRLLGGSSVVNGFAFLPNSEANNIDAWAGLGNPGWDWPSFSKSMSRFGLAGSPKIADYSPLQLTIPDEDSEWPRVWRETLATLGFPESTDPPSEKILGSLMGPETISLDKKPSYSANAYLNDYKILFEAEGITATAVQVRKGRDQETTMVHARKEIIVSAGAINSPRLLELSGIGNVEGSYGPSEST